MCAEADMPTSVAGRHNAVVVAVNSVDNREKEQPNKRHV